MGKTATREQLEQWLTENHQEPYYIQANRPNWKRPSKWVLYPSMIYEEEQIVIDAATHKRIINRVVKRSTVDISQFNQVQILPSWVIIDIDPPKTESNRDIEANANKQAELISRKLQEARISHQVFHTGNTGRHILIKYPELHNYGLGDRQFLKREIIREYAEDYDIDLLKTSNKTLIQMPDTPHRKTLKDKHELNNYDYGINKLPEAILMRYYSKKIEATFRKKEGINLKLTSPTYIPSCIRELETAQIPEGNRQNVLFILLSEWKKQHPKELAWEKAMEYININDKFIGIEVLKSEIDRIYKSERNLGCKYKKQILESIGKADICKNCLFN